MVVIFGIEFAIKAIGMGFAFTPKVIPAYFTKKKDAIWIESGGKREIVRTLVFIHAIY